MERPILDIMRERFSCRSYLKMPIDGPTRARLEEFLSGLGRGPFGSPTRFGLLASAPDDERALRGLGTYGMIRNPQAFIIGVMGPGSKNLEDFGYLMERAVLEATGLGLQTCWLGGSFRKSRFAAGFGLGSDETIPAVVAAGYGADPKRSGGWAGRVVGRSTRLEPGALFFSGDFGRALAESEAGPLAPALEAVRWAPSASNKQPWRIVRADRRWHFYLQRTKGYGRGVSRLLFQVKDLQRADLGIAMCHFELAVREAGAFGAWAVADPGIVVPDELTSYTATWREAESAGE